MTWPLKKHRHFTLTGDTSCSLLAELTADKQGKSVLNVISSTCGLAINNETNLNRLLSSVAKNIQGKVAVSLPLHFFETITLSLPSMPNEAIGQALPYHLAKAVSLPLREYLYDWQITSRNQEKVQLTIYLLPVKIFNLMRRELSRKQLEIDYLDCDLFAAFSFLAAQKRLKKNNATLCLLLWSGSVSIGIYENKIIKMARSFSLDIPDEEFTLFTEEPEEPLFNTNDETSDLPMNNATSIDFNNFADNDDNSILMDFDILNKPSSETSPDIFIERQPNEQETDNKMPPVIDLQTEEAPPVSSWVDYIERVNLEVMRTRDYYISVVKGAPIHHAFLGGADQCFDALKTLTENSLGIELLSLSDEEELIEDCQPIYSAICRGAGTRW